MKNFMSDISINCNHRNAKKSLVTSLILVIATIILITLLIVNLNCIVFTEASVNTTTTPLPGTSSTTSSSNGAAAGSGISSSASSYSPSSTATSTSLSTLTSAVNPHLIPTNSDAATSHPSPATNSVQTQSGSITSSSQDVFAKIRDIESNSTSAITTMAEAATSTTTTTTSSSSETPTNSSQQVTNNSSTINSQDDPCTAATPERSPLPPFNESSKYFDIDFAARSFEESMIDKNTITLYHYLNGFKELMKFFHSLGSIFLFVTSDLETKIGLLENYRTVEKGNCNPAYLTIQSTIEYETEENLLRDTKRQSGARTILRLHRALEFLSAMMSNISKLDEEAETAPAARDAYTNTLAKHHPWTVRTIASFAMRTLPLKKVLVESVLGKENSNNATLTNEKMMLLATVTDNLFSIVDKYYEDNNIKDLP